MTERGHPPGDGATRPRHLPDGLRRGVELDAVVLAPPSLRPGPAAPLRPPLWPGRGRPTGSSTSSSRRVVDAAAADGATVLVQDYHLSLLPGDAGPEAARPPHRPLHPHPLRQPRHAARPARRRGRRDPRGHGRRRRRAASTRRAGSRLPGLLRRRGRGRRATPSCRRSPPTPTTSSNGPRRRSAGAAGERLDELLGGRRMVLRVDRIEPAKNLLRGFWAFDEMLRMRPELRGEVVLLALAYASRSTLPEYLAYGGRGRAGRRDGSTTRGAPTTGRRSSSTWPTTRGGPSPPSCATTSSS